MCVTEAELKQGDLVLLKLGTLHPMQARIVYLLPVAADVRLIGCEFLEEREQFLSEAAEPVQCGAAQ
ncbi:MAG: hypothetical protein ABI759_18965 [Candidatus Solibacter sp.]